jgi:hypothetical protein
MRLCFRGKPHKFSMPCGDRREIEAVGFGDQLRLRIASPVALAVRAVAHGDKARLDQLAIERVGERLKASCCSDAEGQTMGRPPLRRYRRTLATKERALEKLAPMLSVPARSRADDKLLAFLAAL